YDRRAFLPQALRCFQRQDYPNLELIILDDGSDPIADCLPPDPRIRYQREAERRNIGTKRNRACALARGEFIVNWDDDDWYPNDRISRQIAALQQSNGDVAGSSQLFYYDAAAELAWRFALPGMAWVAGNTLAFRRAYWSENPFPEVQVGEDTL